MKNVVITKAILAGLTSVQKPTVNGVQTVREFRIGDIYASFYGEPTKDTYEFAYRPNPKSPLAKGSMICIDNSNARQLQTIDVNTLTTVDATPMVKSATLALLGL